MNPQELVRAIGGGLFQQGRLLKLDTPLGQNVLLPQTVHGTSRLGREFTLTVDAVSTRDNIELKKLIAQPVTLWIEQQGDTCLPWHGYVQTARRLGSDGGITAYQIRFMSWLGFLRYRRDQRIWQDRTADEIVTDVFNQHPQAAGMFRFALSAPLQNRSFCMQFEDDWHFVHRLLENEGLFGYFEQAGDGSHHTLVITDSLRSLPAAAPARVPFQRAASGDETQALVQWSGSRTLQSSHYTTRTFDYKSPGTALNPKGTDVPTRPDQGDLPNQTEVYTYTGAYTYGAHGNGNRQSTIRMEEWESRAKRFHGIGGMRGIDAGRVFELTGHAAHPPAEQDGNRFAVVETEWWIRNNIPATPSHFPHGLAAQFDAMKAQLGDAAGAMTVRHADGSEGFYLVEIEAQRQTVPFRSPFEHPKPEMHLQTATVAGPKGEEVHTDELNRIKVRFHWDRQNEGDERAPGLRRLESGATVPIASRASITPIEASTASSSTALVQAACALVNSVAAVARLVAWQYRAARRPGTSRSRTTCPPKKTPGTCRRKSTRRTLPSQLCRTGTTASSSFISCPTAGSKPNGASTRPRSATRIQRAMRRPRRTERQEQSHAEFSSPPHSQPDCHCSAAAWRGMVGTCADLELWPVPCHWLQLHRSQHLQRQD